MLVDSPRRTGQNRRTPPLLDLSDLGQCRRPLCLWISHVTQARTVAPHVFLSGEAWASDSDPRARGFPTPHRPERPHPMSSQPFKLGSVSTSPVHMETPCGTGQSRRAPCLFTHCEDLGQCRRPLCTWIPHVEPARAAAPHVTSPFLAGNRLLKTVILIATSEDRLGTCKYAKTCVYG